MIDPKSDSDEKLSQVRKLFQDAVDHFDDCNGRRHLVSRFFHNSLGIGQWPEEDRQHLEDEGRPVLSFNIGRAKVQTAIGMHKEQMRKAVVVPVGAEDQMLADIVNAVSDRVRSMAKTKAAESIALSYGYVKGEGDTSVEVEKDPKRPGWVKIRTSSASPHEVHWDPAARLPDRSDASYVTWDRWLSKAEFKQEYPEYEDVWDELEKGGSDLTLKWDGGDIAEGQWEQKDDYRSSYETYYYDKFKRRARVIRIEYKASKKKKYARVNGQSVEMSEDEIRKVKQAESLGIFPSLQYEEAWDTEVHAIDFCGVKILYDSTVDGDGSPPNPYDGFSLVPYVWAQDDELGIPYGMMDNLIDAQMEVNKAWSSSLEHLVGQEQPGWMGEEGTVEDREKFEDEIATRGSLALVKPGAISGQKLQRREVPQPSAAAQQRLANSFEVFDRISGISAELETPQAMNEPATSVAIRYHKSQLALADARESYDQYLIGIQERIADAIMRAMPDDQIADLLSNNEKYLVQGGFVVELAPNPQNPQQKMPAGPPVPLHRIRSMRRDIDLDTSTENTMLRMLKVQSWVQAAQSGVPIPPDLIAESLTDSRSERERLKAFAEQQSKQQAMMAQQQAQQTQQTIDKTLAIEASKVQQRAQSDQMKAVLQEQKQSTDAAIELADVIQRADDNEKRMLLDIVRVFQAAQQRQMGGMA